MINVDVNLLEKERARVDYDASNAEPFAGIMAF